MPRLRYGVDDVVDDDLSTESLLFTEAGRLRDLDVVLVPRRSVALRVRSTTNLGGLCAEGQPSKVCWRLPSAGVSGH